MKHILKFLTAAFHFKKQRLSFFSPTKLVDSSSVYEVPYEDVRLKKSSDISMETTGKIEIILPPYCFESQASPTHAKYPSGELSILVQTERIEFVDEEASVYSEEPDYYYTDDDSDSEISTADGHPYELEDDPDLRTECLLEKAEDMINLALAKAEEYEDLLETEQLVELEQEAKKLDEFRERMDIFGYDSPVSQLLRAELYCADAKGFLGRVLLMIDMADLVDQDVVA